MSGPLPDWLSPIATPASWIYGQVVARRNARFDRGLDVVKLDRPVISVGNITTGGTGKTPFVMWIARVLKDHGRRPVIAMRGYAPGDKSGGMSDEQAEYAERVPDVPVVANPDRIGALRSHFSDSPLTDCVVLDDGFQHRQIARDFDLVLIDARRDSLDDRLLPAGHLREPLTNLVRASSVIVTRAERVDQELSRRIAQHHCRPPLAWSRHAWTELRIIDRDGERREPTAWLQSRRVAAVLGVGNPQSILDQLAEAGATVAANIPARDHQPYDQQFVQQIAAACAGVDALATTGKDWVKLRTLIDPVSWATPIVVPQVAIDVFEGETRLRDRVIQAVSARSNAASGRPDR